MRVALSTILISLSLSGCVSYKTEQDKTRDHLTQFAYANCLMWYFESKGYDTKDIRAISGGIVETSDISLEVFQAVALDVRSYHPDIKTKNNIDLNLLKCFHLKDYDKLSEDLK